MKKGEAKKGKGETKGNTEKLTTKTPYLGRGGNRVVQIKAKKGKQRNKHKNKKGGFMGQVRWPFGPPHLTLKPSKQKKKNNNNPTTKQKQSQNKQKQNLNKRKTKTRTTKAPKRSKPK